MKHVPFWQRAGARAFAVSAAGAILLTAFSMVRDNRLAAQDFPFAACKKIVPGVTNRRLTPAQAAGYLNTMAASVRGKGASTAPIVKPTDIAIGDFNGDGCDDIAEIDRGATPAHLQMLVGAGNGTFSFLQDYTLTGTPTSIAATDVDRDGLYDFAIGEKGAKNGIEVFTGAFVTGIGAGPIFTPTPIVPQKLGGLAPETGRVLNWTAIFDEVQDFSTPMLAASGPNADGRPTLLNLRYDGFGNSTQPPSFTYSQTALSFDPTTLTIGPVGSYTVGQPPRLGTFVGGPKGLDVYQFDSAAGQPLAGGTGVMVTTPTTFHINDTPNPRKVAIGLDTLADGRKAPFTVTLGYGIIVVNGANADGVNLQGFVVNTHANAFDLSVFGFEPQPIRTNMDGGGASGPSLAVAVAPTPEHPKGSVTTYVLPHVLETKGTIVSPQNTFDTEFSVTYSPGIGNSSTPGAGVNLLLFDNVSGSSGVPGLIGVGPNGLVGASLGSNGFVPFPITVRTDLSTATNQYINREAFFRVAASTNATIPIPMLQEQQWRTGFDLTGARADLISSTAPALNNSLLALRPLQLTHEEFPWIVDANIQITTIADEFVQPGGPQVVVVDNAFATLAHDLTQSTNSLPALTDDASFANYVVLIDDLESFQRCWVTTRPCPEGHTSADFYANARPEIAPLPTRPKLAQQGVRFPTISSFESLTSAIDSARKHVLSDVGHGRQLPFARAILSRTGSDDPNLSTPTRLTTERDADLGLSITDALEAAGATVGGGASPGSNTSCDAGGDCVPSDSGSSCGFGSGMCTSSDVCTASGGCFNPSRDCGMDPGVCTSGDDTDSGVQDMATGSSQPASVGTTFTPRDDLAEFGGEMDGLVALRRVGRSLLAWLSPLPATARAFEWLTPGAVLLAAEKPSISIVSNGASLGEALELQVLDPSGAVKKVAMPEGIALEPLKKKSPRPPGTPAKNLHVEKLGAFCLQYLKLPPAPGTLYKIGSQALQQKYAPVRNVLQAARQLQTASKLHPDSSPAGYFNSIKQYALWTTLEKWDQKKFGEVLLDKTKQSAAAAKANWTPQMENALTAAIPGRWRDITAIVEQARHIAPRPRP